MENNSNGTISVTAPVAAKTQKCKCCGRVLPIGGLKEKVIGAHRAGIRKIFLPVENKKDLEEIPEEIKKDIKFIFVDNYKEIYKNIF